LVAKAEGAHFVIWAVAHMGMALLLQSYPFPHIKKKE
jgi:hypothetical protein